MFRLAVSIIFILNYGNFAFANQKDEPCDQDSFLTPSPDDLTRISIERSMLDSLRTLSYGQFKRSFLGIISIEKSVYNRLRSELLGQLVDAPLLSVKDENLWLARIRKALIKNIRTIRGEGPLLGLGLYRTKGGLNLVLLTPTELDRLPRGTAIASITDVLAVKEISKIASDRFGEWTAYGLVLEQGEFDSYLAETRKAAALRPLPSKNYPKSKISNLTMEMGESIDEFKRRLPLGTIVEVQYLKNDAQFSLKTTLVDGYTFDGVRLQSEDGETHFLDLDRETLLFGVNENLNEPFSEQVFTLIELNISLPRR